MSVNEPNTENELVLKDIINGKEGSTLEQNSGQFLFRFSFNSRRHGSAGEAPYKLRPRRLSLVALGDVPIHSPWVRRTGLEFHCPQCFPVVGLCRDSVQYLVETLHGIQQNRPVKRQP